METLKLGAEARLTKEKGVVTKNRIKKSYRVSELDVRLRLERTRREASLLDKARRAQVNVPNVLERSDFELKMDFVPGKRVDEVLTEANAKKVGVAAAKLHDVNIIHGDLTTSNILVNADEIWFIDFGLGEISKSIEKKAVDLRVLKEAIRATKGEQANKYIRAVLSGYKKSENATEVLARLEEIEKRGRYK